uniref:Secreted protein n=1 Tax=Anopheles coluzzii TaxID=1518534 RepID=A0A8W7PQH6_ANOCL
MKICEGLLVSLRGTSLLGLVVLSHRVARHSTKTGGGGGGGGHWSTIDEACSLKLAGVIAVPCGQSLVAQQALDDRFQLILGGTAAVGHWLDVLIVQLAVVPGVDYGVAKN